MLAKKKIIVIFITLITCLKSAYAADLLEVYNQAQQSDPVFQQAIAQKLSTKTGVPITFAGLLPSLVFQASPSVTRTSISGTDLASLAGVSIAPRNTTTRAYQMSLTLTQTLFDFGQFSALRGAYALSHYADATLNAALQDLMIRVAKAYFEVLKDEDKLRYSIAAKRAFKQNLDQVQEQFNVGTKTLTEKYTAQASYDSANAEYIGAKTKLNNDRETLRALTGRYYPHLAKLRDDFPLVRPQPNNMEAWVKTAQKQNWQIKAWQYYVSSKLQNIRQQFAGHLPTINVQASASRLYTRNLTGYNSLTDRSGPGTTTNKELAININFPILSGGGVIANTNKATYDYELAQQQLEAAYREALKMTRQSYFNIMAGISKVDADKLAIKSTISSLEGMRESFKVGTETLVDVLNQQQKVYENQSQYATDRYDFVMNILMLKQAAGTLSFNDLRALNGWLKDR